MKKLKCILLIDDDIPTNFYNRKIIEQVGCAEHVESCTRAELGLEFLKKDFSDGSHPQPELIFLDLNMPGMNGWEFLDAYDALPLDCKGQIIVVMLTTSVNPDDERRAIERGIHGFARKPLTKEGLSELVRVNFG